METEQLTSVGGLMQESMMSPMHGFDALGSDSIEEPLPTPDPYRTPLLTFTAPASGNDTVSWNAGGSVVVHWGDGTSDSSKSHTYTGLNPGDAITISLESPYNFGFSANADMKDLGETTFWWDGVYNTTSLNLKNMGITRRMPQTMTRTMSLLNLEGNAIEGKFPPGIMCSGNVFIKNNRLTGNLPRINGQIKKYQVQGNAFRGDIHDISNYSLLEAYLAYGQDDGNTYSRVNPRIMLTGTIPDLSNCSSLTFYHVGAGEPWNRGFKNNLSLASDFNVTNILTRFYASNCQLSTAEIDKILNVFANAGTTSPNIIDLSGTNGAPTSSGLADAASLVANGWNVNLPVDSGALPPVIYTVKGRVAGNANSATFSNGAVINDDPPTYDLITEVEAGENVNLTYTSQNEFDEFTIDSGTVGSSSVGETNFVLTNVQSNIECTILRTD